MVSDPLVSLRQWQHAKPFSTDSVSIKNLDLITNAGFDVWGRPRSQRILVSVKLSLQTTFASAAQTDTVDSSTVHYGKLSKCIVSRVEALSQWHNPAGLIEIIYESIHEAADDPSVLAVVEIEIFFVKASRAGEGISLQLYSIAQPNLNSAILSLRRAHLLALIGVNSNERTMKQMVVVSVALDRVRPEVSDRYFELEQIVEKTVDESSYETLESLAEDLAVKIIKYFILARQEKSPSGGPAGVRITIEKPSAVPFADAPIIEVYRSAEQSDPAVKRMTAELGKKIPQIPFPLQGRLDEFLNSWKQD